MYPEKTARTFRAPKTGQTFKHRQHGWNLTVMRGGYHLQKATVKIAGGPFATSARRIKLASLYAHYKAT